MKTIKNKLTFLMLFVLAATYNAQTEGVSIKTTASAPHTSAMLEVESSTKGVLIPRVALTALNNISPMATTPATALLVYNTTSNSAVTPGFYYWEGVWKKLNSGADLWKVDATNSNSIYYNVNGVTNTVTIGTGTTGVSTTSLFVYGPAKFNSGGGGTGASPVNDGIFIGGPVDAFGGHWNEINVRTTSLDLQWGTANAVSIGSGSPPGSTPLNVNGPVSSFSDSTIKKNIRPLTNITPKLKNIQGYQYNYKSEANTDKKHLGMIAQELELEFPELVKSVNTAKYPQPDKMVKAVDYLGLTAILLQAIKEQQVQIDQLKVQVQVLQGK